MSALTADRAPVTEAGGRVSAPVEEATRIFGGSLVNYNSAGYAVPGADTDGHVFAGVAYEQVDNRDGADGDLDVELITEGVVHFVATGLSADDVGKPLYVKDDQTVVLGGGTLTEGVYCGTLAYYKSATVAPVRLDVISPSRRTRKGDVQLFTFEMTGPNATTFDLSTPAGYYGGSDIYVTRVLWMEKIVAGTPDDEDRLVVTTDWTLSAGVLTAVGNLSSATVRMAVLGRLKE